MNRIRRAPGARTALVLIAVALSLVGGLLAGPKANAQTARLFSRLTIIGPWEPRPVGDRVTVDVELVNRNGRPVPNKVVVLYLDGQPIRRARTDDTGRAAIRISQDLAVGRYHLAAVFPGTEAYRPANAETELIIRPVWLEVVTVPPLAGMEFRLNGRSFVSAADGSARIAVERPGPHRLVAVVPVPDRVSDGEAVINFVRWHDATFTPDRELLIRGDTRVQAGFSLSYLVGQRFVDLDGNAVPPERITGLTVKSSHGAIYSWADGSRRLIAANRIARRQNGLEVTPIQYSIESVVIDGTSVVNKYQQRFFAQPGATWDIHVLLYFARIRASDALLGFAVGQGIDLHFPDGRVEFYPFQPDKTVLVGPLARGLYRVRVVGVSGLSPLTPVALSRQQDVRLKVLTVADMALALGLGLTLALGLLFYGRPRLLISSGRFLAAPGRALFVALHRFEEN